MKAKIYTKTGDQGKTALIGGQRVAKSHPRLEAYGSVDELNSCLGLAISLLPSARFQDEIRLLQKIQNQLFNLGSRLACEDDKILEKLPAILPAQVQNMESEMDLWESELAPLKEFILPGGHSAAAALHLARTICRRAERHAFSLSQLEPVESIVLIYLNRLSDFLFTMARKVNALAQIPDITWTKAK